MTADLPGPSLPPRRKPSATTKSTCSSTGTILRDACGWWPASPAAVFVLALVLTLLATPIFRASRRCRSSATRMQVVNVEGVMPTESPMDRDFYQTQYELLQSRSLALRVVQDLKLVEHPQYAKLMAAVDESLADKPQAAQGPALQQARERAAGRHRCSGD